MFSWKGVVMSNIRALSTESKIYHRSGCRYAKRIQVKNRMDMPFAEAKHYGYRPCKRCNTMEYVYESEWCNIDYFRRKKDIEYLFKDGILYIKTNVSCWKIIYSKKSERVVLYHRNSCDIPVDFTKPENEQYHLQKDCASAITINALLKYIYEHDRYREAQERGVELTSFTSKKSRILAARSKRREQYRRVDDLFAMLEQNNKGYRKLSYR